MIDVEHHGKGAGSGSVGLANHLGVEFAGIEPQHFIEFGPFVHGEGMGGKDREQEKTTPETSLPALPEALLRSQQGLKDIPMVIFIVLVRVARSSET